jgi:hypothetical protein
MKPPFIICRRTALLFAATALTAGCADPLLGPTSRAQGRQCNQLVVPEQREACFRDLNGDRPAKIPRDLEKPRAAAARDADKPAAPAKEDAAAKAARRGMPDAPNAAMAPAPAASAP